MPSGSSRPAPSEQKAHASSSRPTPSAEQKAHASSSRPTPSEQRAHAKVRAPRSRPSQRREARGPLKIKTKRRKLRHRSKCAGQQGNAKSTAEQPAEQHICPICHESYSATTFPVVHAPCGHVACASCSVRWQEKNSSRTCALCRAPILSIAHCHMLEQVLRQLSPKVETDQDSSANAKKSHIDEDASRLEIRNALQELSQGDLNNLPGDYRSHIVRAIAYRAIRKQNLPLLKKCLQNYRARASTHLICDVANLWTGDPRPVLSLLLEHGARINGHADERPLLCAVSRGNNSMIAALLEFKADPLKPTGPFGETPLHAAACCGRFEAARILLDHGVRADIQDRAGRTPLLMAEKGLRMHLSTCEGPPCERCEARIQLQGELRWRSRYGPSQLLHNALQTIAQQRARPSARPQAEAASGGTDEGAQQDAISDYSSSDWEDSTDVSDVADFLEDEEEEDEHMEGEESESDYDEDEDDDAVRAEEFD